ncbi:hypothetical protein [Candidatus Nitrosotenuis chungbukensis]|uniref:hypothetical protein n=1 Tax=Candidatus Nitrosotenuis chungbukensis TaxID=1353246 RepID=UPI003B968B07
MRNGQSLCESFFKGKERWNLVRLKKDGTIKVENPDDKVVELPVRDYKVDNPEYASFLIDDHVNKAIEI